MKHQFSLTTEDLVSTYYIDFFFIISQIHFLIFFLNVLLHKVEKKYEKKYLTNLSLKMHGNVSFPSKGHLSLRILYCVKKLQKS